MAQGTLTLFEEFADQIGEKEHDFGVDTMKVALITTIPVATQATPTLATYTEVTGTNYTAGGEAIEDPGGGGVGTYTEVDGVATFDAANITWSQNAAGPATIKAALLYNSTHASDMAWGFIDMTADGSTPISLIDGDITITWHGSGIFTVTV